MSTPAEEVVSHARRSSNPQRPLNELGCYGRNFLNISFVPKIKEKVDLINQSANSKKTDLSTVTWEPFKVEETIFLSIRRKLSQCINVLHFFFSVKFNFD